MNNRFKYLRVSLIDRCNLFCYYCRPEGNCPPESKKDNFEKYKASIKLLSRFGIEKIRFTGGEPTLYKKLPELVAYTKEQNSKIQTCLTSNAVLLEKLAPKLALAGLDSINISIDTLDQNKFKKITKKDSLDKVISGIKQSKKYIPLVKLNCVLINGFNNDEIEPLIIFANELKIDIRFIEYMPTKHNSNKSREYISGDKVKASLPFNLQPESTNPSSAARYYRSDKLSIKIGFINPVSHTFCTLCNRVRLSSDGHLYGCLFSGNKFNLFEQLNNNHDDVYKHIEKLLRGKNFRGCSIDNQNSIEFPSFSNIGG